MLRLLRIAVVGVFASSVFCGTTGCRTSEPLTADGSELAGAGDASYDFCVLSQSTTEAGGVRATWSAARVQQEIKALVDSPAVRGTPWAAYPALYLRMTAERDKERCSGRLRSATKASQMIGDRLADVMTRFYVLETAQCTAAQPPPHADSGFCGLIQRVRAERYDALSSAMATTAIYISSHIALSLRAVVADEPFWQSLAIPKTVQADPALARQARLELLSAYRPDFDRFNDFLADQLATVVKALDEQNLLRNTALSAASELARHVSFRSCFFGKIRDQAFAVAVDDAKEFGGRVHPMLVETSGAFRVEASRFDYARQPTARERALEAFALDAVAGPAQRLIYRHLLGGKTWDELWRDGQIAPQPEVCLPRP